MQPDEELCLCFHVTKRKVVNFLRIEKPRVASQLSECHGAGTGCGWCRPYLLKLFELHQAGNLPRIVEVTNEATAANVEDDALPAATDYAKQRASYVKAGGGTPPAGATPIE